MDRRARHSRQGTSVLAFPLSFQPRTASGFAWSQIAWISPTQLPIGVCKGLICPSIKHIPISWCHSEHPASAWQHPLPLNMGLGLPHL